jgi:transposase InsO family protein
MKLPTEEERTRVALWRYEIIAPLLGEHLPRGAKAQLLREVAAKLHVDDKGRLVIVSQRSIERYLSYYLKGGLEALKPKIRPEKNSLKAFPQETLNAAIELRLAHPELSADSIIDVLKSNNVPGAAKIRVSTLNRHFRRLGKDRPALKRLPKKRYRLLTVDGVHQLWICDVWDGPLLFDPASNKRRRLRLVAIIDSFTRVIIHAEFYFNENRPCLEDTLLKAILKYGIPERYYVDNAKVFQSNHLKRIGAELGFRIQHSQPYRPQGRGRIERWFRTVAEKFEPLLVNQIEAGNIKDLCGANQFLLSWIETRYHQRHHGSLKMSPAKAMEEAVAKGLVLSREADPEEVKEAFLWRETRQVSNLATVKIYNNLYEVDESLMGKYVEVRYNPYDLRRLLIFFEGEFRGEAKPYKMHNFTEKRVKETKESAHKVLQETMEAIIAEHAEQVKLKAGVSFARVMGVKEDA